MCPFLSNLGCYVGSQFCKMTNHPNQISSYFVACIQSENSRLLASQRIERFGSLETKCFYRNNLQELRSGLSFKRNCVGQRYSLLAQLEHMIYMQEALVRSHTSFHSFPPHGLRNGSRYCQVPPSKKKKKGGIKKKNCYSLLFHVI